MKRSCCVLGLFLLVFASAACFSDSIIPITGNAGIDIHRGSDWLSISGTGFNYAGAAAGSDVAICVLNSPCVLTLYGFVTGELDSSFSGDQKSWRTDAAYTFRTAPFTIFNNCVDDDCLSFVPFSAGPIPALFSGVLTPIGEGTHPVVKIYGLGMVTLGTGFYQSGAIEFYESQMTFTGAADVVPEPSSILLFGSGLSGMLVFLRRRVGIEMR